MIERVLTTSKKRKKKQTYFSQDKCETKNSRVILRNPKFKEYKVKVESG